MRRSICSLVIARACRPRHERPQARAQTAYSTAERDNREKATIFRVQTSGRSCPTYLRRLAGPAVHHEMPMSSTTITNCSISATAASWSGSATSCSTGPARGGGRRQIAARIVGQRSTARFRGPRTRRGLVDAQRQNSGCPPSGTSCTMATSRRFTLQLEAFAVRQVGVFPEQRENWDWIARQVAQVASDSIGRSCGC